MKSTLFQFAAATAIAVSLMAYSPTSSAATASTAATSTKTCKDGTTASGKGACRDHGGVAKKTAAKGAKKSKVSSKQAQAAGGGADKVWANTSSKNYHCQGGKYYGKTRVGEYMSEADAKAKGFRGKACSTAAKKA